MVFKLREDNKTNSAIELMYNNDQYQDDPMVGIFWYDRNRKELFGVKSTYADEATWYNSKQFDQTVRTERSLHKNVWTKEKNRRKDHRFQEDYIWIPRGRVFEFKDIGFRVYVGDWIDKYPEAKALIIEEFQLPIDTEFVKDTHWDLGRGWSQEF